MIRAYAYSAASLLLVALAGCSSPSDVIAPTFEQGQGQPKAGTTIYPAGPYGIGVASTIENFEFRGFSNSMVARDPNALENIRLGDFYNPHVDATEKDYSPVDAAHDDRLYPPGSPYGEGTPKPRVLLLDVASVWCPPCNDEAKTLLPPKHLAYKPCGGEFALVLIDGPTPGTPATPLNLVGWTKKYSVDFPAAIDPSSKLSSLFDADAFPSNIIVDTKTMTVIKARAGEPDAAYWKLFESKLTPGCLTTPTP
jgi:hypothetical protein